jgi:phenylpropionate dioxygenase-like ring-hydroxylating dioxygenase large terminal subunit
MATAPEARRPETLKVKYGAYYHREIPQEDVELTHVGPGTPGGEYLRRFWQPIAFSRELKDLPLAVQILGEELVLFRDKSGRVGLLELHCAHRGASLEYGRIEDRGIRCCYHGWLYDPDGTILEMPGEPAGSTYKDRFCHGAYPTLEFKGMIFTYMGPPDKQPEFPMYDSYELPGIIPKPIYKNVMPCNWLQIQDNIMDPAHLIFLHTKMSGAQFTEAYGLLAQTEWQETPIGSIYIDTRRVGENAWVHICDQILPNINQFPPLNEDGTVEKIHTRPIATNWAVPIDDTHTLRIGFRLVHEGEEEERLRTMFGTNQARERSYEERQRQPGDWEAQTGQRSIAIHALEHLGTTDRGVTMFRKSVREGIRAVQRGEDPKGIVRSAGHAIPTLCQDTVLRVPPASTEAEDAELLRRVGRLVASGQYDVGLLNRADIDGNNNRESRG